MAEFSQRDLNSAIRLLRTRRKDVNRNRRSIVSTLNRMNTIMDNIDTLNTGYIGGTDRVTIAIQRLLITLSDLYDDFVNKCTRELQLRAQFRNLLRNIETIIQTRTELRVKILDLEDVDNQDDVLTVERTTIRAFIRSYNTLYRR